jgi:ElaB/YqjD/DUF883 family membrane-anchored ribosome-binding protein
MAKKGYADRLRGWKEDIAETMQWCPEQLNDSFGRDSGANHSRAVLRAATYFNLDVTKKADSGLLLQVLAEVVFPNRGRQSGTAAWSVHRLAALAAHWRELEQANPGISDNEAAKEIKKRYPKQYQSADAIRVRLPEARVMIGVGKSVPLDGLQILHKLGSLKNRASNLPKMSWEERRAATENFSTEFSELYAELLAMMRRAEIMMRSFDELSKEERGKFRKEIPSVLSQIKEIRGLMLKVPKIVQKAAMMATQEAKKLERRAGDLISRGRTARSEKDVAKSKEILKEMEELLAQIEPVN